MLILRTFVFSSHQILLATSLLIGVSAILASIFAVTSGRWIHVFRSFGVGGEEVSARADLSPTLQQKEPPATPRNVSEDGNWRTEELHFTAGCLEEHGERTGDHCATSAADRGSHCADEAYGGLWGVCLVYHCVNGRTISHLP